MTEIKVYTVEEVSEILKLGTRTIKEHIKKGKLKAVKISNRWRVKHEDLEKFLDN